MKTLSPIPVQTFRGNLLEHLNQADRFLVLIREPKGRLTYMVKGIPEDIEKDIEEFMGKETHG